MFNLYLRAFLRASVFCSGVVCASSVTDCDELRWLQIVTDCGVTTG